jgi:hypothetical protein
MVHLLGDSETLTRNNVLGARPANLRALARQRDDDQQRRRPARGPSASLVPVATAAALVSPPAAGWPLYRSALSRPRSPLSFHRAEQPLGAMTAPTE